MIRRAPRAAVYGGRAVIRAKPAKRIEMVVLMRPGAVTHSVNMEQRYLALAFRHLGGKKIELELPDNPNLAPPGYYLLFLVNDRGAVSEAAFVHVGAAAG